MSEKALGIYERLILLHPKVSILAVVLVAIAMAFGIPKFKLDASVDSLSIENDPALAYYRESLQNYGSSDFLVVTYTPNEGELFDDDNLKMLSEIRDVLKEEKGVEKVSSILDVPLLYSPKISIKQLKEAPRTLLQEGIDRNLAKKEFHESPIYRDLILSKDGQTTALLVLMKLDIKYLDLVKQRDLLRIKRDVEGLSSEEVIDLKSVSQIFLDYQSLRSEEERQRIADIRGKMLVFKDRAEIFLGGPSMITADMVGFIKNDIKVFGVGILLFIIIILVIIFRQFRWVFLPLVACILSVEIVFGYLGWIDWHLTVVSCNFAPLLLIITLALTIHLIVRYRELQHEYPDKEQLDLVRDTVSFMARPCVYSVLTTVVAFVSLVVSNIRPVIDFGWMMTIGTIVALTLVFIIIPAGMMIIGKGINDGKGDNSAVFTLYFSRFTEKNGGTVLGLASLALVVSVWGISYLQVENRFIDYFHSKTEIYQGLSVIDAKLGGTTPLDILLDAPLKEGGSLQSSADLLGEGDLEDVEIIEDSYWLTNAGIESLKKIHVYLESLEEVGKVNSLVTLTDVASDLSGHKLSDMELAFMALFLSPENAKTLFLPYLDENNNQARITLRVNETQGHLNHKKLLEKIHHFVVDEVGLSNEQVHFTGLLVLYNNMLQSLFQSLILTIGAVFLGIAGMFLVLFRSVYFSLIALLPNLLAASLVLGIMGLTGIPLDMMTITIAAITVGIGVDHSIHYITRFKREYLIDGDYIASMHRAHASIGRALFYTAITIIAGFSILALSNFIPSVYFGLLTGFAMLVALLGSMTLLPKLILIFKPLGK